VHNSILLVTNFYPFADSFSLTNSIDLLSPQFREHFDLGQARPLSLALLESSGT
jgi:hypothetical protein